MTAFPTSPIRRASAPRLLLSALVAGLLVLSLPTSSANAQSGVERLTNKVDRLQRELNDLQRQVYRGEGGSQAAPSEGGGQASGGGAGMTQAAAARLQQKLAQLERTVQDLTGRMERVQYELRQLTQRLDKRSKDVDYRLSQLEEATGVSATGDGQQTGQNGSGQQQARQAQNQQGQGQQGQGQQGQDQQAQNVGGDQTGQGGDGQQARQSESGESGQGQQGDTLGQVSQRAVDELRQNQGEQPSDAQQDRQTQAGQGDGGEQTGGGQNRGGGENGNGGQQTASLNVELPDGPPQERYDYAFGLLRQADYAKAEQALSKFLDAHPEHALAGNAKYWLGETFYVRGNYERAAVTFAEGFQTYPDSQKAPDNLLKLGMSLAQIDRTEDACGIFAELQSRYPDAKNNILQRAEREQERLNCGQG